jgi:hypothetical protein
MEFIAQLENMKAALLEVLSSFSEEEINTIPFEGSWTAGQVAEHIYKSASGISQVLQGAVKRVERDPAMKVKDIAAVFLNFDIRLQSPSFIIPSDGPHHQKLILRCLKLTMEDVIQQAKVQDMQAVCVEFELPQMGALTRLEWNYFILYHTQRHIHQLKKIKQGLTATVSP